MDEIYEISGRDRANVNKGVDDDFSFAVPHLGRFRVNVFRQRGSLAAVIRVIRFGLPDPAQLVPPQSPIRVSVPHLRFKNPASAGTVSFLSPAFLDDLAAAVK